jgi:hypothetical protein
MLPFRKKNRSSFVILSFTSICLQKTIRVLIYFAISLTVYKHCCPVLILCVQFLFTMFSKSYKTYFHLHVDHFDFHGIVRQGAHLNLVLYYLV